MVARTLCGGKPILRLVLPVLRFAHAHVPSGDTVVYQRFTDFDQFRYANLEASRPRFRLELSRNASSKN